MCSPAPGLRKGWPPMVRHDHSDALDCCPWEPSTRPPLKNDRMRSARIRPMNAVVPTTQSDSVDAAMMRRCLQLSEQSVAAGERPFGAVLAAGSVVVAAAGNRVEADRDVTRHAEVVALAEAQRLLR